MHKSFFRPRLCCLLLGSAWLSVPAQAMQPLKDFVVSAKKTNPDAVEARAALAQRQAGVLQAWGRVLPAIDLRGSYTRNELNIAGPVALFVGRPPVNLVISPFNQWDGSGTVTLALLDLASDLRVVAAHRSSRGQRAALRATQLQVEGNVSQTYFQVVASHALVEASQRALEVARADLELARNRFNAGSAAVLEMDRAEAELQRQVQQLANAELNFVLAVRSLHSMSGLEPDMEALPVLQDDLRNEAPLAQFEVADDQLPTLRAAKLAYSAARSNAAAAWFNLVPTLKASFNERATNATAFNGQAAIWTAKLEAAWHFDAATVGDLQLADAQTAASRASLRRSEMAVRDGIHRFWSQVMANIARSRAARIAERVSKEAVELAQDRYRAGVVTQLDLLQAQRDAYTSEVNRVAADADLVNSRLQLRLAAGHDFDTLVQENDRAIR